MKHWQTEQKAAARFPYQNATKKLGEVVRLRKPIRRPESPATNQSGQDLKESVKDVFEPIHEPPADPRTHRARVPVMQCQVRGWRRSAGLGESQFRMLHAGQPEDGATQGYERNAWC